MGKIIPRWEWRTFAKDVKLAINLNDYEKTRHVESKEVYVLSDVVDENPKVRDNKMDVKSLQQVNEDGLEQWKPILKVDFPLPKEQLVEVYRVFRVAPPAMDKDIYTFDDFMKLAEKNPNILPFQVEKIRDLYDVDTCIVEYATVKVDGKEYKTAAEEDPDPSKVKRIVEKMGLWGRENINYVKALKRIRKNEL